MPNHRLLKLAHRLQALERTATLLNPHQVTVAGFQSEFEEGFNWSHELVSDFGEEKIPDLLLESKARVDHAIQEFKDITTRMSKGSLRISDDMLFKRMSAVMHTFFYHSGTRKGLLELQSGVSST